MSIMYTILPMHLGIGNQAKTGHYKSSSASFSTSLPSLSSPSSLSPSSSSSSSSLSPWSSPSSLSSSLLPSSSSSSILMILSVSPQFPVFVVLLHHPSFTFHLSSFIHRQGLTTCEAVKLRFSLLAYPENHPPWIPMAQYSYSCNFRFSTPTTCFFWCKKRVDTPEYLSAVPAKGHCASKRMMVTASTSQTPHCWLKYLWVLAQAGVFDFALFRFCFLWIFLVGAVNISQPLLNIDE